jgi:hypothetical protein
MVVSHIGFAVFAKWASSDTAIMTSRRSLSPFVDGPAIYDLPGHVVLDETLYLPSLDNCLVLFAKALLQLSNANDPLLLQCGFHLRGLVRFPIEALAYDAIDFRPQVLDRPPGVLPFRFLRERPGRRWTDNLLISQYFAL